MAAACFLCLADDVFRLALTFGDPFLAESVDQFLDAGCRLFFAHVVSP